MRARDAGPTARQTAAWDAVNRLGKQAAAAAELGITHCTLRSHLLAYMRYAGVAGPVPSHSRRTPLQRLMDRVVKDPESGCWVWTGHTNPDGYGVMGVNHRPDRTHRISWKLHRGPIPAGAVVRHHCDNPPCVNPDHLAIGTQADNIADMVARKRSRGKSEQRGEANSTAVLTEADVLAMRAERRAGASFPAIASRYGVGDETARYAVQGRTWAHLPGAVSEPRGFQRQPNAAKTHCPYGHEYTPENTGSDAGKRRCKACDRERFHRRKAALRSRAA